MELRYQISKSNVLPTSLPNCKNPPFTYTRLDDENTVFFRRIPAAKKNNSFHLKRKRESVTKNKINNYTAQICRMNPETFSNLDEFITHIKQVKKLNKDSTLRLEKEQYCKPYTIQCFSDSNGEIKDSFIFIKTKNNVPIVGNGAYKRVTIALHAETKKIYTCASAKFCDLTTENEINTHKILENDKKYFVSGKTVLYEGSLRSQRIYPSNEFSNKKVKKFCVLTEWMEFGTLLNKDMFFRKKSPELLNVVHRILVIIDRLHSHYGLVYGDIKLENFFIDQNEYVKLGDFGLTEKIGNEITPRGSPLYAAPEIISKQHSALRKACEKVDIWAIGILFSQLNNDSAWYNSRIISPCEHPKGHYWLVNPNTKTYYNPPIEEKSVIQSKNLILCNRKDPKHLDYIIDLCLEFDAEKRPSAKILLEKMNNVAKL